ncbi:hypothetical protein ACVWZ8_004417 [Arthrobacter sp. UYCu723]
MFEQEFCAGVVERLSSDGAARLEALIADGSAGSLLAVLKADPGPAGLESLLAEVEKLSAAQSLEVPADLSAGVSEKVVGVWRARASRMYPSDFWDAPKPVRLALLAALCHQRTAEITDSLVDLLLVLVLKINTSAVKKVEKELTQDLQRVRGKTELLFKLAETAVEHPDETVRDAVFPVVSEKTLQQLVKEAKANETVFQGKVRIVLRSSYSNHYRRMLPALVSVLQFRCNNTAFRPIMDAIAMGASASRSMVSSSSRSKAFGRQTSSATNLAGESFVAQSSREFLLRFQPLRDSAQLGQVHPVVVAALLVRLAHLRVLEHGQLGHHFAQQPGRYRLRHVILPVTLLSVPAFGCQNGSGRRREVPVVVRFGWAPTRVMPTPRRAGQPDPAQCPTVSMAAIHRRWRQNPCKCPGSARPHRARQLDSMPVEHGIKPNLVFDRIADEHDSDESVQWK